MRNFLPPLLALLLLFVSACTTDPTIDGSSPASAEASISEVREALDEDQRMAFDQSFELIVRDEIHRNLDDLSGEAAENVIIGHVIERVDGKTGHEVIELGRELSDNGPPGDEPERI